MDPRALDQLDKILALADSSHEGEAIVAVRKARQMLSRDGLTFGDLARSAASGKPRVNLPFSIFSGQQMNLEAQIAQLQQRLDDAQAELQAQILQTEFWRRRSGEIEQSFIQAMAQVERWRTVARETVEKLWDLGQTVQADEVVDKVA